MSSFATLEVDAHNLSERGKMIGTILSDCFAAKWAVDPLGGEDVPVRISIANAEGVTLSRAQMTPMRLRNQRPSGDLKYYVYTSDRQAKVQIGEKASFWVMPQELLVLRSDVATDWTVKEPYLTSSLIFDSTLFEELVPTCDELIGRRLSFSPIMQSVLGNMIESAWELTRGEHFERSGGRLGRAFLDMLSTAIASRDSTLPDYRTRATALDARLCQIKAFIRNNFADPELSVSSIASAIRISPRYVQLAFAAEEATPSEFVRHVRLETSALLLRQPECKLSITEIAYNCGFNSSSHFSTQFKQYFGMSPRDYRTKHCYLSTIN